MSEKEMVGKNWGICQNKFENFWLIMIIDRQKGCTAKNLREKNIIFFYENDLSIKEPLRERVITLKNSQKNLFFPYKEKELFNLLFS